MIGGSTKRGHNVRYAGYRTIFAPFMESTEITINEHGFYQFPIRDIRRLFVVLVALERTGLTSTVALEDLTGHHRHTIAGDLQRLRTELYVDISVTDGLSEKRRPVKLYELVGWGPILNREGVVAAAQATEVL